MDTFGNMAKYQAMGKIIPIRLFQEMDTTEERPTNTSRVNAEPPLLLAYPSLLNALVLTGLAVTDFVQIY